MINKYSLKNGILLYKSFTAIQMGKVNIIPITFKHEEPLDLFSTYYFESFYTSYYSSLVLT
jgi:hypothetical protein